MELPEVVIKPTHAMHPDDERFDRMTVDILPRWKESELSGDEYRFSYNIGLWRKGELIVSGTSGHIADAPMILLNMFKAYPADGPAFDEEAWNRTLDKCDQPGCDLVATVFFELTKQFTKQGDEILKQGWDRKYRQFCDNHKDRGDAGLDDSNANYFPIDNPNA